MRFPPEAYIIGAEKSGTTTLAHLLDQHPSICLSNPKEPHFYTWNWPKGIQWYQECFAGSDDAILLDASVSYTFAPKKPSTQSLAYPRLTRDVPKRISETRPNARFIYLLRDPVERTYSAYWHKVRYANEKRPFRTAIKEDPGYLDPSDYYFQLSLFLEHFPPELFMFVDFNEIRRQPVKVANDCLRHLGLDGKDFQFTFDGPRNQAFAYNTIGTLINELAGKSRNMEKLARVIKKITPSSIHKQIKGVITKRIPGLSDEDRLFVSELLAGNFDDLEAITGIRFEVSKKTTETRIDQ